MSVRSARLSSAGVRIGVDIGGTFTDIVVLAEDGRLSYAKVSSTPDRPEAAVIEGLAAQLRATGFEPAAVTEVLHGTTVGSNALLQKSGARCGLITTRGFRDVLEIGRVRTPSMFDLNWEKPEPLIPRQFRQEVDERVAADGMVLRPVDPQEVGDIALSFARAGIESVAICFLNSYRNPINERRAAAEVRRVCPEIAVTASVAVLPEIREYERTSTTAVNAYVLPVLRSYLQRLAEGLSAMGIRAPLLVANSNGGLSTAEVAQEKPVFFISSGRSAGVAGAAHLGSAIAERDLIVFDMGGTTASASLIRHGELSRTNEYEFRAGISTPSRFIKAGGYMMRVPTIDVAEVGSGGGSIAGIDAGGLLTVGPRSAGAVPGPVCYGSGGMQPTVTDANVALGLLPPTLAGGTLALDVQAARVAIGRELARPLGLSFEEAALGVREVANANMERAIRAVTTERGVDARDFTLLAFGGSGPAHACDLAKGLGIRRVLFPRAPGVFTAMGMLAGNVERYFVRSYPASLARLDTWSFGLTLDTLEEEGRSALAAEGHDAADVDLLYELDLRFAGQDSELPVPLPRRPMPDDLPALREVFLAAYRTAYGYASNDEVELVNIRLTVRVVRTRSLDFLALHTAADSGVRGYYVRSTYMNRLEGWLDTPVIDRAAFDGTCAGPLILESSDATIVVPTGALATVDAAGNVIVTISPTGGW